MENLEKHRCKLCFSLETDENFEEIKDADKDILDALLLTLSFDYGSKQIMCNTCSLKVTEAFIFKSMCLSTDNILIPYVDDKTVCSVDLNEIYAKETLNMQLNNISDDHKICRLCMQLIRNEFTSVNDIDVDIIEKYIPEINFSVVHHPVVCRQCFDSISTHGNFIKNCLEIGGKIKDIHNMEVSASPYSCIKSEEIDIKYEEDEQKHELLDIFPITLKQEDKEISNKIEDMEIKSENEDKESDVPLYNSYDNCMNECDAKDVKTTTNSVYELEYGLHSDELKLKHLPVKTKDKHNNLGNDKGRYNGQFVSKKQKNENTSDVSMYKCHMCNYKAKHKCYIVRHQLIHLDPSEVPMYKCHTCDFRTKRKCYLAPHQLKHKNPSQMQMYNCGICDFKTKGKSNLVRHELIHKDPSEVHMHECHKCDFRTKHKINLVNHQLIHKHPSELQMYECDICHFKCKRKRNLKNHQLKHRDFSETQMYKCDVCVYETKSKYNLLFHQKKHKDRSEVPMYKCNVCDYETKHKSYLTKHQRVHKDLCLMQMYKCDSCSYKTEYKKCFDIHQCKIKNPMKWNQEVIEKINKSILSY